VDHIGAVASAHLEHLSVTIGSRPAGSRANLAAAGHIRDTFDASGLAVEMQEIPCPAWQYDATRLELDGVPLVAGANAFSPSCDVTAPARLCGTMAELAAADLSGRIAVLYGEPMAGTGLGALGAFYCPERDQRIYQLLVEKQPAAVLAIHPQVGSLQRLINDPEFIIPSATVPAEVGLALLRQDGPKLHLTIRSRRFEGHFGNVIGRKAGARPERVVLCAHFDTVTDTPGAIDNASGVSVLLTLAQLLRSKKLSLSLEWIAFNGHENGGFGGAAYLRQSGQMLGEILVVINVDGVGGLVGANSITMLGQSPAFQEHVAAVHSRYPGVAWVDPWYESDHTTFVMQGVPAIPLSSLGVSNTHHLPADTIEWVSPDKLGEAVSLVTEIIERLQDKSPAWCRGT
jgi:aminopeptidase YwaD